MRSVSHFSFCFQACIFRKRSPILLFLVTSFPCFSVSLSLSPCVCPLPSLSLSLSHFLSLFLFSPFISKIFISNLIRHLYYFTLCLSFPSLCSPSVCLFSDSSVLGHKIHSLLIHRGAIMLFPFDINTSTCSSTNCTLYYYCLALCFCRTSATCHGFVVFNACL